MESQNTKAFRSTLAQHEAPHGVELAFLRTTLPERDLANTQRSQLAGTARQDGRKWRTFQPFGVLIASNLSASGPISAGQQRTLDATGEKISQVRNLTPRPPEGLRSRELLPLSDQPVDDGLLAVALRGHDVLAASGHQQIDLFLQAMLDELLRGSHQVIVRLAGTPMAAIS